MKKPQTVEEYLSICKWVEERNAPQRHPHESSDCLGWKMLEDYANGKVELNVAQLQHVKDCRFCFVRAAAFAGLTREEARAMLQPPIPVPPMAVQFTKPQPPDQTQQSPAGATPAFAGGVLSSPRKSADAAVDVQKAAADAFIWKRESEVVNGWLSFESSDGETVQPHVELKPPPGKTTFLFRYENGAKEIPLTIDSDGHSEPCEGVPVASLTDWELVAPDGELEWKTASESPS
jgi:hypothetical protein